MNLAISQRAARKTAMTAATNTDDAFFSQSDWDFQLDTMQDKSIEALQKHLESADDFADTDNVAFLRDYLVDARGATFTPFND